MALVHVNELLVLFLAGLAVAVGTRSSTGALLSKFRSGWVGAISFTPVAQGGTAAATAFGRWPMFHFFLKVGSVLFGSGYGYLLAGPKGALVATVGIFVPAFFFVTISGLALPRLRRSPVAARCWTASTPARSLSWRS